MEPDDRSWQLAISFIAAWRGTGAGRDPSAVAHRLAEVTADGNATTIEEAVLGLTTLGNMFLELYAERAGSSADAVAGGVVHQLGRAPLSRAGNCPGPRQSAPFIHRLAQPHGRLLDARYVSRPARASPDQGL